MEEKGSSFNPGSLSFQTDKEDSAYCGLNCALCKARSAKIKEKALELNEAMEEMNFGEVAKVIPFMHGKYKKHQKLMKFFTESECPGCKKKGGNPFCGIRKCAHKSGYTTCAQCDALCRRFNMLKGVHRDGEIQNNIKLLGEGGVEKLLEFFKKKQT